MSLFVISSISGIFCNGSVASNWVCVFDVGICKSNTLLLLQKTSGTMTVIRGCCWEVRQRVGFNVVWAFDVMKDQGDLFAKHSPGHDAVGCVVVLREIDVISVDIGLGTPHKWSSTLSALPQCRAFPHQLQGISTVLWMMFERRMQLCCLVI